MIGVRFHEVMRGSWHRLEKPADEMPIEFDAKAEVSGLGNLVGDAVAKLQGTVKVSGPYGDSLARCATGAEGRTGSA